MEQWDKTLYSCQVDSHRPMLLFANADEIKFHDGRTMTGTVVEYKEGYVAVQKPDDEYVRENIALIAEILFKREEQTGTSDVTKPGVSPEIQRQISEKIAETKKDLETSSQPKAMVALYLDTESPHDFIPQGYIEYRCYSDSGGYSGSNRVPLRQAWTRLEYTRLGRGCKRRIQLDPGPPYETINRDVLLTDGAVTNLGRIVLKRVKAEGTADIHGTVKDSDGNPLADVDVSAGSKQTRTDAEGKYVLDSFGLEVVSLKASKDGYFGGTAQVSIRNMDNREIEQDLVLHRPRHVKLKYVIGGKKSDSLVGSDAEEGTIELTVGSIYFDLSKRHFSSKSFFVINQCSLTTLAYVIKC